MALRSCLVLLCCFAFMMTKCSPVSIKLDEDDSVLDSFSWHAQYPSVNDDFDEVYANILRNLERTRSPHPDYPFAKKHELYELFPEESKPMAVDGLRDDVFERLFFHEPARTPENTPPSSPRRSTTSSSNSKIEDKLKENHRALELYETGPSSDQTATSESGSDDIACLYNYNYHDAAESALKKSSCTGPLVIKRIKTGREHHRIDQHLSKQSKPIRSHRILDGWDDHEEADGSVQLYYEDDFISNRAGKRKVI